MAESKIRFEIGSVFKGEGFDKAKKAVKSVGDETKKAAKAVQDAASAMGDIGGAAGKAANAIGGVVQGFMGMGIVGGVIAGGTMAINGLFNWLNKTNEAIKDLAVKFKDDLAGAVRSATAAIGRLGEKYTKLSAQMARDAKNRTVSEGGVISRMELDKQAALVGKSGTEAARIELEWTKRIEDAKTRAAQKAANDTKAQITLERKRLEQMRNLRDSEQNNFKSQNAEALRLYNDPNSSAAQKVAAADAAQVIKRKIAEYDKEIARIEAKILDLSDQELKDREALTTQTLRQRVETEKATQKSAEAVKRAQEELAKAKEAQAKAARDAADAERKAADLALQEKAKEIQKKKQDIDQQFKAGAELQLKAAQDAVNRWNADHADAAGKTFKEFMTQQKQASGRKMKTADDLRFDRLDKAMQRGGKALSKADREWYEKRKHWMEANGGKNPHLEQLSRAEMLAQAARTRQVDTLEKILKELKEGML